MAQGVGHTHPQPGCAYTPGFPWPGDTNIPKAVRSMCRVLPISQKLPGAGLRWQEVTGSVSEGPQN